LNLYSRESAAFGALETSLLDDLVIHCAIALTRPAEREQNVHLRRALRSNREIGIAVGVLMASKLTSEEQAFEML
jgi:AmiR/NasT family two-component response regulator